MRNMIMEKYSGDGIIGEEYSENPNKGADFTWTLDPIDGTASFVKGVPLFGTLVGLISDDRCVLGVANYPLISETIYATSKQGAMWKPSFSNSYQRCSVSSISKLRDALFCHSGKEYFLMSNKTEVYNRTQSKVAKERTWGDCYGYLLVATGRSEIMIDPAFHIWDLVPMKIIIEEAGGYFSGIEGQSDIYCNSGVATNAELSEQIRALL